MLESNHNMEEDKHSAVSLFRDIKQDFQKYVKLMRIVDPVLVCEKNKYFEEYFYTLGASTSLVLKTFVYFIFALVFCFYCLNQSTMLTGEWYFFASSLVGVCVMSPVTFYTMMKKSPLNLMIKQHVIVLCTILMGFMMFVRVRGGPCESDNFSQIWHCNPQGSSKSLPQDFTILLMLLPISEASMWGEMNIESVFASWMVVILSMSTCIAYGGAYNSITTVVAYTSVTFFLLFEQPRQCLLNFFYMRRLDQSRTATVKQAGHFREEFRSLMGNMTHDLKTVRAAFNCLFIRCKLVNLTPSLSLSI